MRKQLTLLFSTRVVKTNVGDGLEIDKAAKISA